MFTRALIAFLALPGMVAFVIPAVWLVYTGHTRLAHPLGLVILAIGAVGLAWCIRDFYVAGGGTLAPWEPPKKLVIIGLYRYSRNPMYISVVLVLLGWAVTFSSPGLTIYSVLVLTAFHVRVVWGEEPRLARMHGIEWELYAHQVPRWLW